MVTSGEGVWEKAEMGKGGQKVHTSKISHGDVIYRMVTIVNNIVYFIPFYADRRKVDQLCDHFAYIQISNHYVVCLKLMLLIVPQ